MQAAPEKQRVLLVAQSCSAQAFDLRLQRQPFAQARPAGGARLFSNALRSSGVRRPRNLASTSVSSTSAGKLGGEGLGRGDADFGPGAGQEFKSQLAVAHQRRFRHVADGQAEAVAERLRVVERGQRVGGFARLRDRDDQRVGIRHRCRGSGIRWRSRRCTACRRSLRASSARPRRRGSWCRRQGSAPLSTLRQDFFGVDAEQIRVKAICAFVTIRAYRRSRPAARRFPFA